EIAGQTQATNNNFVGFFSDTTTKPIPVYDGRARDVDQRFIDALQTAIDEADPSGNTAITDALIAEIDLVFRRGKKHYSSANPVKDRDEAWFAGRMMQILEGTDKNGEPYRGGAAVFSARKDKNFFGTFNSRWTGKNGFSLEDNHAILKEKMMDLEKSKITAGMKENQWKGQKRQEWLDALPKRQHEIKEYLRRFYGKFFDEFYGAGSLSLNSGIAENVNGVEIRIADESAIEAYEVELGVLPAAVSIIDAVDDKLLNVDLLLDLGYGSEILPSIARTVLYEDLDIMKNQIMASLDGLLLDQEISIPLLDPNSVEVDRKEIIVKHLTLSGYVDDSGHTISTLDIYFNRDYQSVWVYDGTDFIEKRIFDLGEWSPDLFVDASQLSLIDTEFNNLLDQGFLPRSDFRRSTQDLYQQVMMHLFYVGIIDFEVSTLSLFERITPSYWDNIVADLDPSILSYLTDRYHEYQLKTISTDLSSQYPIFDSKTGEKVSLYSFYNGFYDALMRDSLRSSNPNSIRQGGIYLNNKIRTDQYSRFTATNDILKDVIGRTNIGNLLMMDTSTTRVSDYYYDAAIPHQSLLDDLDLSLKGFFHKSLITTVMAPGMESQTLSNQLQLAFGHGRESYHDISTVVAFASNIEFSLRNMYNSLELIADEDNLFNDFSFRNLSWENIKNSLKLRTHPENMPVLFEFYLNLMTTQSSNYVLVYRAYEYFGY
ncbi:MAG: hypothetical protein IH840_15585, partial [Candidatus Heimdallarchaeota archaeon]|nr:hypothetical protein [Candidatus Heimdallarchaeota archaeon]